MSQNSVDFSVDCSGDQLLDDLLTDFQQNFLTQNSGTSRPSYAVAGTFWMDTASNPWVGKVFNGTSDIVVGTFNTSTLVFKPSGIAEVLNNYSATTNPTVNDDSGDGYSVGSIWYNSTGTGEAFLCTSASLGAAVWIKTTLTVDELGEMAFINKATNAQARAGSINTAGLTPQSGAYLINPSMALGHIKGLICSNNATDTLKDIDFSAGSCASEDGTLVGINASTVTKRADATWAAGSGNGGMASGQSMPASGTVHFFALLHPSNNTLEFGFDTSVSATNLLADSNVVSAGYTKARRILSMLTTSSNFIQFVQHGNRVDKKAPVLDFTAATNPGTSAVNRTLSVPVDISVEAIGAVYLIANSSFNGIYISAKNTDDLAPSSSAAPLMTMSYAGVAGENMTAMYDVRTDTTGQVRTRLLASDAGTTLRMSTHSWRDLRGQ